MIPNGYKLLVSPNKLDDFILNLRTEMTKTSEQCIHKAIAKEVQKLYDFKFIEGCRYENNSILNLAIERVGSNIQAIKNGVCADNRYDFRSSIILIKNESEDNYFALFNCSNEVYSKQFEQFPEVKSYKFYITGPEKGVTKEENEIRGNYWRNELAKCDWNKLLLGINAQLTVQPDLGQLEIKASDIMPYFDKPKLRMQNYCHNKIVQKYARAAIGNIPITNISPYELTNIYLDAEKHFRSSAGKRECLKLIQKIEKGFLPVSESNITLIDTDCPCPVDMSETPVSEE